MLYVFFEELAAVILALAYGKNEIDDVAAPVKKQLNALMDEVACDLRQRSLRWGRKHEQKEE